MRTPYVVVSLSALLLSATASSDATVTAIGSVSCHDGSLNTTFPLAGVRVELWDSDCDGSTLCDDFMGSSIVQSDGSFSVTGTGGDLFGGDPDPYLRFVYNDDMGVRLTDELNHDRYVDTPEHDHSNVGSGTLNFGAWVIGSDVQNGDASKCGVWSRAHDAYREYVGIMGTNPPSGHYDVEYWSAIWSGTPWTNTDTTHWPIHYPTWQVLHEFGHVIRHAADGDANHFNWDVTRFRYARNHDICDPNANRIGTDTHDVGLAFGFNEGWAEFWRGDTTGCWAVTIDDELEGNIAWGLNVLASTRSKKQLVDVLIAHPGEIHSLDQFISFLAVGSSSAAISVELAGAEKKKIDRSLLPKLPSVALASRVTTARAEIGEMTRRIEALKAALPRAIEASHVRPCLVPGCAEQTFQRMIGPVMIRAEIALAQLAVDRSKKLASEASWSHTTTLVTDETLGQTLLPLREDQRQRSLKIVSTAFRSIAALNTGHVSEPMAALFRDFEGKRRRLEALFASGKVPLSMTSQTFAKEDSAVPRK